MRWRIEVSKASQKFIKKNKIRDADIISYLGKAVQKLQGQKTNVDLRRMKGQWEDFFRLRIGKIRIIFKIDFENKSIGSISEEMFINKRHGVRKRRV